MEYTVHDFGSYKLYMIKTNKFKTITTRISFRTSIKKEEITIRNVLCEMFTQSSKNYPSKRSLAIKAEDLYNVDIMSRNSRLGNYMSTDIYLETLHDKYTEEGNFESALEFFKEIVFNPDINNKSFNKDKLNIVKNQASDSLNSLKEQPTYYSLIRMFEELDDSPSSYRMVGYKEDLDKITETDLYDYYNKMIKTNLVDIFVIGDIDFDKTKEMIQKYIKINTLKKEKTPYVLNPKKPRLKINYKSEKVNNSQSKLSIACLVNNLSTYERNYPLTLCNIIFGGGVDSKLFKQVREEKSLCYTINSVPNKLDNLLIIRAGIASENCKQTIKVIEKCLDEMKKGKFTEDDINVAKEFYKTALDDIEDNETQIMEDYFLSKTIDTDTIDIKRQKMKEVTKDEIIAVAKKIKIDTVFLLEGDQNE